MIIESLTGAVIGSFGGHTVVNSETGAVIVTSKEVNALKVQVQHQ